MFLIGLTGFIIGFVFGMAANAYMLRGVPRETLRANRDLRMKYGLMNWGLAALGAIIAIAIQ